MLDRLHGGSSGFFSNENTGEELPEHLVRAAREEECSFMDGWEVWEEVPVAIFAGSVLVVGFWVQGGWDANKGDKHSPDVAIVFALPYFFNLCRPHRTVVLTVVVRVFCSFFVILA